MAAYKRMMVDGRHLEADEAVVLVELKGMEYAKLPTLARTFDVSANQFREILADLCTTHEIRVLPMGQRLQLVNLRDFRRALFERFRVRSGWVKEGMEK